MKHLNSLTPHRHPSLLSCSMAVVISLAATALALAAAGGLDPTFSGNGKFTDWAGRANSVVIQPDGKILTVGTDSNNGSFVVARYNADGKPDASFGGGSGKVITDLGFSLEIANAVALQPDGKIVAVGTTWDGSEGQWGYFALVRYHPDGSLDQTFGGDGIVTERLGTGWVSANTVAIQTDGKIIAAGVYDYYFYDFPEMIVIRYNADGSPDLPFGGGDGKATEAWVPGPFGGNAPAVENVTSIAIQPDGKIVAAGYSYGFWLYSELVRLNADGSPDVTFSGGIVYADLGSGADVPLAVAIQSDGKLVTAGYSNNGSRDDFAVIRYLTNGSFDTTFDFDGKLTTSMGSGNAVARAVALQPDGKILVAGNFESISGNDFVLVRYNADGRLDTTFGGGGKAILDFDGANDRANGIALDGTGRAVVVGQSNGSFAIARFRLQTGANCDFDGDGKADISVFRSIDRTWYLSRSQQGFAATQFGISTDKIVPGDYDGDGKTDIAVYRDGTWYWLGSSNGNFNAAQFGLSGDVAVPADYTGDGRDELAIYRAGQWWTFDLMNQQASVLSFGLAGDKPVPADYDGDGRIDQAVYRGGAWYINRSTLGYTAAQFGLASDTPVAGDYDGDGRADLAVYRDGTWYLQQSTQGIRVIQFGLPSDIPVSADYDGDGTTDPAVYRNGIWYLLQSTGGFAAVQFGSASDRPVPSAQSQ